MFRLRYVVLVGDDVRRLRLFLDQIRRHIQIDSLILLPRRHLRRIDHSGLLQKGELWTVKNPPEYKQVEDYRNPDGFADARRQARAFQLIDDLEKLVG